MRAGQRVVLLLICANRDEREFVDPERFDAAPCHGPPPRLRARRARVHRCARRAARGRRAGAGAARPRFPTTRWSRPSLAREMLGIPRGLGPDADRPALTYGGCMTQLIIDADTHLTEPPDVWTTRVPAAVPRPGAARGAQRRGSRRVGARRHAVQQPRAHRGRGLAGAVPRRSEDLRGVPPGLVRRRRAPRVHGRGRDLGAGALPERRRLRQPALPQHPRRRAEAGVRARVQRLPARLGVGRRPPPAHDHVAAVLGRRRGGEGDRAQPRQGSPRHPLHR